MENIATKEHPVLAHKYSKLSIILRSLGEIDEALEIQTKALDLREKIFGRSHVNYAHSCNFLSLIYLDKKDFANAILYQDIALNIRLSQQSEYSFELAESYYNYALIMKEMGDLEKSIEYIQKINNHLSV